MLDALKLTVMELNTKEVFSNLGFKNMNTSVSVERNNYKNLTY
jgi:hypothetical protein